jgi:multimeric flavodoxin WrbA
MKVLLINGSPKENGNTFTALSEVAKTLDEEGMQTMRTLGRNMAWMIRKLNDKWDESYIYDRRN